MKLSINFSVREDIGYSQVPTVFHGIFSSILHQAELNSKHDFSKKSYAFYVPQFQVLVKNKVYTMFFVSNDELIIEAVKKYFGKDKLVKESYTQVIESFFEGGKLLIKGANFKLSESICKNWNIDNNRNGKKKILNFSSEYGVDLLKEMVEYQLSKIYTSLNLAPELPINKNLPNGTGFFSFIDTIKITKDHYKIIKGYSVKCVDFEITMKKDLNPRIVSSIANIMLNQGIGNKNSFGFGFVEENKND